MREPNLGLESDRFVKKISILACARQSKTGVPIGNGDSLIIEGMPPVVLTLRAEIFRRRNDGRKNSISMNHFFGSLQMLAFA